MVFRFLNSSLCLVCCVVSASRVRRCLTQKLLFLSLEKVTNFDGKILRLFLRKFLWRFEDSDAREEQKLLDLKDDKRKFKFKIST